MIQELGFDPISARPFPRRDRYLVIKLEQCYKGAVVNDHETTCMAGNKNLFN